MFFWITSSSDLPWMWLFATFAMSLLLSAKYALQLAFGERLQYRPVDIASALVGTCIACLLARDGIDWCYSHSSKVLLPYWGIIPIVLAIAVSRLHFQFAKLAFPVRDLRDSLVVWSMLLCSLGTTTWSAYRLHEEETRDLDLLFENDGGSPAGATVPVDAKLVTDRGREIELYHWELTPKANGTPTIVEPQYSVFQTEIISRSAPDTESNCHGWVFTGGLYHVQSGSVEQILEDNDYMVTNTPQTGDLVVHRNRLGEIQHTGVVRGILDDGTVIEESKWGAMGGRFLHSPDAQPYGTASFYRSLRQGHLMNIISANSGEASKPVSDARDQFQTEAN